MSHGSLALLVVLGKCIVPPAEAPRPLLAPRCDYRLPALGSGEEATPDTRLAARCAGSVLDNDPSLPEAIEACTRRWGKRGLAGLATAVTASQLYQTRPGTRNLLHSSDGVGART